MNKNNLNFSVIFLSHPPSTIAISVQDISALIDNGRTITQCAGDPIANPTSCDYIRATTI